MNKALFERLRSYRLMLVRYEEEHLFYFLDGLSSAFEQRRDDPRYYLARYLDRVHHIDFRTQSWIDQMDHYAHLRGESLVGAFLDLVEEVLDREISLDELTAVPMVAEDFRDLTAEAPSLETVQLSSGREVRIGDRFRLSDRVGEDYRRNKYYDLHIKDPSWELFHASERDFRHLAFYCSGRADLDLPPFTFGRVWRIFSHFKTVVRAIRRVAGKVYLATDLFWIDIEAALAAGELTPELSEGDEKYYRTDFYEGLADAVAFYRLGWEQADDVTHVHHLITQQLVDHFFAIRVPWMNAYRHFRVRPGRNWIAMNR
ncbi:MAG: hypothetical protein AAFW73_22900 [Bacteroidota bacterium]